MKKILRRWLPSHQTVHDNAFMRRFGHWFVDPRFWHLNRGAVAGGMAVGLFCGLVPGPLQILSASILALVLRINLPVAIFATFFTNPLTIGPLYWLAFQIGVFLTGASGRAAPPPMPSWSEHGFINWLSLLPDWFLSMGTPLLIGLPVLGLLLAGAGYLLVWQGWRAYVLWQVRKRKQERNAG
jgi:uncharacterized protein